MQTALGILAAVVALALPAGAQAGSFTSSDPLLDAIWTGSAATAADMIAPGPLATDWLGRPCPIDLPVVVLDGAVRDRCVDVGDLVVDFATFDVSTPHWDVQRSLLRWYGEHQRPEGAIPASPDGHVLVDYGGYWVLALHDYALASGDLELVRELWPHVVALLDTWYPAHTANGLFRNDAGANDYAFIPRRGTVVAYYNAEYALALEQAAELARWIGDRDASARWLVRAQAVAGAFGAFWDPALGVYHDTTSDTGTHPQDGNAFAVLAGIADREQARSALDYLSAHDAYSYGNSLVDTDTWDGATWGYQSNMRVYPFMSYFEVLARFQTGLDGSALDLVRREWGYMLAHGPGRMWESIAPFGGSPPGGSWDHGWSSGAAPALVRYVLGVEPTSPGYATFTVTPHTGGLTSAAGTVPTPHGDLAVSWRLVAGKPKLTVTAPPGTTWTNPPRR